MKILKDVKSMNRDEVLAGYVREVEWNEEYYTSNIDAGEFVYEFSS